MKFAFVFALFVCLNSFGQDNFDVSASAGYQKNLDKEYADPKESPLTQSDLQAFKGLDFFPVDAKYIVDARFVKSENEKSFEMKTTGARRPKYVKFGELHFTLEGRDCKLNVYQNVELTKKKGFEDYLFLPFSDLTSGKESYVGGRYIDMRVPKSDKAIIDFNRAYNPYCAYNPKYSCPIVPLENDLAVEIRAGVKKFHD